MLNWLKNLFRTSPVFSPETEQAIKDLQKQGDDFVAMTRETEFAEMPSSIIIPPEEVDELIRFEFYCPKCGHKIGVAVKKEEFNER